MEQKRQLKSIIVKRNRLINRISRRRKHEVEHGVEIERVKRRSLKRNLTLDQQLMLGGPGHAAEPLDEY